MTKAPVRLAVLWAGDRAARSDATPSNNRYKQIFDELASLGIQADPAVYADDMVSEVRDQLLRVDGVLVWSIRFSMAEIVRFSMRCCATWPQKAFGSALIPT
jgi:hypothetical protein